MARRFDAAFVSPNWYRGSKSEQLGEWARFSTDSIPEEWRDVVGFIIQRINRHEETMHRLVGNIHPHMPIHPDPYFVYKGYKEAMKPIMDTLQGLKVHEVSRFVWDFKDEILTILHDILAVLRAESHDRAKHHQNF
ncbi:hypothetical protein BDV93DRAFT_560652 [Ceratobasidium sp. AG-I]|nr:hypothetical protein BDV93DRAFT_560652 [Ceratobasidium sp. AG-I]